MQQVGEQITCRDAQGRDITLAVLDAGHFYWIPPPELGYMAMTPNQTCFCFGPFHSQGIAHFAWQNTEPFFAAQPTPHAGQFVNISNRSGQVGKLHYHPNARLALIECVAGGTPGNVIAYDSLCV